MGIKIRPIALKDAASFRQCRDAVAKEGRYTYEDKVPAVSVVRERLRKNLRKKPPFLVAVEGERVVGWAAIFRAGVPSLSHGGALMMSLHPEYRGMGLGTKLANGVLKKARGKFELVTVTVFGKSKRAQRFFKTMGFARRGREKKAVKLVYGFDDIIIMQISLLQ